MVNKKGGKAYKKGKHQTNVPEFTECEVGQMYARVLKILGNCRVVVYCNDDERRICHIRGAIRKRVWIEAGDIVIVSSREFESSLSAAEGLEKGDVLSKVDPHHYGKLKKDPVFNMKLMCELEKVEFNDNSSHGLKIRAMMAAAESGGMGHGEDDDDTQTAARNNSEVVNEMFGDVGFEFDRGGEDDEDGSEDEDEEDEEEGAGGGAGGSTGATPDYAARHKVQAIKRNAQRAAKGITDADIDNI
jgi:translation initiation factor 1A